MRVNGWHVFLIIALGYILGYYFPALGQATVGKLIPYPGQRG